MKDANFKKKTAKHKPEDGLRARKGKPFKKSVPLTMKKPKSDADSIPPEIAASLLAGEDNVPDFPRGGASVLSRSELAQARTEAELDFEGEERTAKKHKEKKKGGRKTPGHGWEEDWASLYGEGISGKLPRFANRITSKNISPNMKLWGVVSEVNTKDLVISLPGGLRGLVHPEDASDIFSDYKYKDFETKILSSIVHVGQLVPCIVTQVNYGKMERKGSIRILLSLRLSLLHKGFSLSSVQDGMVINAYVKTIEDHGYILGFGLSSFSGFLPKNAQDGRELRLKIGQLTKGVVKNIDKARSVVFLSSDIDSVSTSAVKDLNGLSVDALVPGMMVNARVHAILENGIMLSFLTYFTGTVDLFHMQSIFPKKSWKEEHYQNKKVNARILFIDSSTRAVGLTLNPHLIRNTCPPQYVKTGDIFDNARIIRIDKGFGLSLELPSIPEVSPAYISRFEVAEKEILNLDKKFKEGSFVRVRVIGLRLVEGVAIGTLKTSAFEGSIFTHSDVEPGMSANGKVISVGGFGAYVQFSCGVKALCPVSHMSEFEITKPPKKFKNGAKFLFRVLGCKLKRLTVTHKKTMVKSKLPVVASYSDAINGLLTHGWIAKIETHGCFVRFYNGVHGFANRDELGMEPGSEPSALYHVGQVIKCRILASNPASRKINISFNLSSKRTIESDCAKVGSLISGTVQWITSDSVVVDVNSSHQKGTIYNEHLADHHGHTSSLKLLLKPGYKFDQLLVLDDDGNNLTLSAKHSLIMSSQKLPLDITQIHQNSVLHGYICNIIGTGCFVRFLGNLTGFSPLHKATDEHISTLSDAFYTGQSVRSSILNVNKENNRITLSLKQSCCFSTDASLIQGYFLLEEKIAELQTLAIGSPQLSGVKPFRIGQLVEVEVQEKKEYGVVFGFKGHSDVVGFATQYHLGGKNVETGSSVKAVVVDISEGEGLVDLSLKPELLGSVTEKGSKNSSAKKKRQKDADVNLELHKTVNAVVEIVKENYLVLSIPECNNAIGFASILDYNTQKLPLKSFVEGQRVSVTIEAIPSSSSRRLLLLLKSLSETSELSSKRAKKISTYVVGSIVQAEITDIKPLELFVKFGDKCRGRIHITEVIDDNLSMDCPLLNFRIGQVLSARIVAKPPKSGKGHVWELSLKPSLLAGAGEESHEVCQADADFNFSIGQAVRGYVTKVNNEWVSLMITRLIHGQLYIFDSSCDPNELQDFNNHYKVGDVVSGHVICLNPERKLLRLISRPLDFHKVKVDTKEGPGSTLNSAKHILEGDVVGGRIKKILPGVAGMLVQIGPHLYGKVNYTELSDTWTDNPLFGYQEGQYVKCNVLEISRSLEGFMHVELSLLSSLCGANSSGSAKSDKTCMTASLQHITKVEELHPNMPVKGYVKHISSKGCFIMLSRKIDARVLLSNLSDEYIQNTKTEFSIGKLVVGRVLSVEPLSGRVDITLKTGTGSQTSKSEVSDFSKLRAGEIVSGSIRRVESYGLFITIDQTNMVGLCHISNISESSIEKIESGFRTGDRVQVKILKVDQERKRISLGMKDLNCSNDDILTVSTNLSDALTDGNASNDDKLVDVPTVNFDKVRDIYVEHVEPHLRSSIPPLDVKLDDMIDSDLEENPVDKEENLCPVIAKMENSKKRSKKREREERELLVSASEERLLENDVPRTSDEFEKLVRTSPDSSFVWIKYMAFLLSLADVERARSVAERALRIINIREENEKMNVWVAYFNLENEYGNPPEDAVRRTFERALQYCEPKKLYFALLGIYERSEKQSLVDELLEKMTKKFKNSCKVWLHYLQSHLKQNRDVQGVVKRALLCLSRHKHIKFISQAAILEFKFGLPDRGRSMFEGMLREYPKRTDLWSVYLDQEIRLADVEVIRALFERVTCLSLPPKKMKFLLKKYLEYEKSLGDEGKVEYVTSKALDYASSL